MTSSDVAVSAVLEAATAIQTPPIPPAPEPVAEFVEVKGLVASLLSDCVHVDLGEGMQKVISYQDFLQSLSAILGKETALSKKTEYFLPQNTFYFATSATEIILTCYYPECVREINYMGNKRLSVVPNILISHLLVKSGEKWKITDTRYLCTDKKSSELPRKHYMSRGGSVELLPFTNVYDSGLLCYGSNVRVSEVTLPDMKGLHWYYEMLFDSPFNNDLGIYALDTDSSFRSNYGRWYEHLANLATQGKPFPYNELRAFRKKT